MPRVFVSLRFPVLALAACLTLWRPAVAAPADGAAPDRVYPPLPSMSLLPAGTAAAPDDGAEPAPSSAHAQAASGALRCCCPWRWCAGCRAGATPGGVGGIACLPPASNSSSSRRSALSRAEPRRASDAPHHSRHPPIPEPDHHALRSAVPARVHAPSITAPRRLRGSPALSLSASLWSLSAHAGDCFEQAGSTVASILVLRAIARHESKGDPAVVHCNTNGSVDVGRADQLGPLRHPGALRRAAAGLTDACVNIYVAARLLKQKMVKYGNTGAPSAPITRVASQRDDYARRIQRIPVAWGELQAAR